MAVKFTSLRVIPHLERGASGGFDVSWSISGQTFTPTFQVYMAPTSDGPWTAMLSPKTSSIQALGLGDQKFNLQAGLTWFKIGVFDGSTSVVESWPMDARNQMPQREFLRYREVLRRWRLTLDLTPCLPGFLLRRRVYGARCPVCTDAILATPQTEECSTCYGTGIEGGYYPAVAMRADWGAGTVPRVTNATVKGNSGPEQVQKSSIRIFAIPDANSEDIWVDAGTRFFHNIEKVTPDQWSGSVTTQVITISRLPVQHQVHNFPLT